ncbi:MAG: hypothetical protein DRN16_04650, partial [Thermoplasmata archaeon]
MKGKILVVSVVIVLILSGINVTGLLTKKSLFQKIEENKEEIVSTNLEKLIFAPLELKSLRVGGFSSVAKKSIIKERKIPDSKLVSVNNGGGNKLVTPFSGTQQNPSMVSDNKGSFLVMFEHESYIGATYSTDGGESWPGENAYYWEIKGEYPRLDYFGNGKAYASFTPTANRNYSYFVEFKDISKPWRSDNAIMWYAQWSLADLKFESSDVACYSGLDKPFDEFWGVVGYTGDVPEEDDTLMIMFEGQFNMVYLVYLYNLTLNFKHVSVAIDNSRN